MISFPGCVAQRTHGPKCTGNARTTLRPGRQHGGTHVETLISNGRLQGALLCNGSRCFGRSARQQT